MKPRRLRAAMSEQNSHKGAIETFKEAVKDWNSSERGLQLPFFSTLFTALGMVFLKMEERRFEAFLDHIRIPLAFGNTRDVVAHIAEHIEEPWMSHNIEKGWRMSLETMEPLARECAYLMVADYLANKCEPDGRHRQFSTLFLNSERATLRVLLELSDQLAKLTDNFTARGIHSFLLATATSPKVAFEHTIYYGSRQFTTLHWSLEGIFEYACDVLVHARLASPARDLKSSDPRAGYQIIDRLCQVDFHHLDAWKALRRYLDPARKLPPIGKSESP